jgi:hypothetical protein
VIPRPFLAALVGSALLFPIVACVLAGFGRLLAGMGDVAGAVVADRLALAIGVLWIIDLIVLVIAAGVQSLDRGLPPDEREE